MAALVDIYNMAMGRIGETSTIADPNENSVPARSCNRYYHLARKACLTACHWPFARRVVAPVPLDLAVGIWPYAWAKPGDCEVMRRMYLDDTLTMECDWSELSYIGTDDASRPVFVTDNVPVWLEYTADEQDTSRFSAPFVDALAWRLAADVAMSIANARALRGDAMQAYREAIQTASAHAGKAHRRTIPDSEIIRARN